MARLGFEPRITVRPLHPDRFRMRSPAPSKRIFREPLEAEDNQPDTQPNDGCAAKRESDHHADHMSLPRACKEPKLTTSRLGMVARFQTEALPYQRLRCCRLVRLLTV